MIAALAFTSAVLPCLLVLRWYVVIDKHAEPPKVLLASFGLGVLAGPLVILAALIVPIHRLASIPEHPVASGLAFAFLGAAIPEEFFKWIMLRRYCLRHPEFDEPMDGIVYGATVSLGFATIENVAYVLGSDGWFSVAVARAFLAIPSHAATGAIMGYFLARHHFSPDRPGRFLALSLLVPVMLHGIYDAPFMASDAAFELGLDAAPYELGIGLTVAVVIFELGWTRRLAKRLRDNQESQLERRDVAASLLVAALAGAENTRDNDLVRIAWCPGEGAPGSPASVAPESTQRVRADTRSGSTSSSPHSCG